MRFYRGLDRTRFPHKSEPKFIDTLLLDELPTSSNRPEKCKFEQPTSQNRQETSEDGIDQEAERVDVGAYASLLRNAKALSQGKLVHSQIIVSGLERNGFLTNLLVQMYGNCGALDMAYELFSKLRRRNVFSWNFMIQACAQHGLGKEAFQLFVQMQGEGLIADKVLYLSMLSVCDSLDETKGMHARIVISGYEPDILVMTVLIKLYGKCSCVESARRIFDKMPERDTVSWTAMIAVYAQHKLCKNALELFDKMEQAQVKPDDVTFVSILSACASQADLLEGKKIHSRILDTGFDSDLAVANALLNMYGKCGGMEDAENTFEKMVTRDAVSWTAMVAAYAQHGRANHALQLFDQMHNQGLAANKVTFVSAINACDNQTALADGKKINFHIICCGFESDLIVCNAIVNMYGKCGSPEDAWMVFHKMPEKDVVSWNAIVCVYAQNEQSRKAFQLFTQMQHEGMVPDEVTFVNILDVCAGQSFLLAGKQMHACILNTGLEQNVFLGTALINMYSKCGSLNNAQTMFDRMPEHDTVSWNALVGAYAQDGQGEGALRSFEQMQQEGLMPDKLTFISVLSACASHVHLAKCKCIHACVVGSVFEVDLVVGNALLSMYGKCGSLDNAQSIFDKLPTRDVFSWNAMIAAHAQNGRSKLALQLLPSMQKEGVMPDKVTFVCLLAACSNAGLVDEGNDFFVSMQQDHGLTPDAEHFNCMINLLGRVGRLEEAEDLIHKMPFEPTPVSWLTLLGACKHHVDVERGERAADLLFRMDPSDVAPYMLLSNMYVAAGREDDAAKVLARMTDKVLKLQPGSHSIEVTYKTEKQM